MKQIAKIRKLLRFYVLYIKQTPISWEFLVHGALAVVYSYKRDMIRRTSMNLIIQNLHIPCSWLMFWMVIEWYQHQVKSLRLYRKILFIYLKKIFFLSALVLEGQDKGFDVVHPLRARRFWLDLGSAVYVKVMQALNLTRPELGLLTALISSMIFPFNWAQTV